MRRTAQPTTIVPTRPMFLSRKTFAPLVLASSLLLAACPPGTIAVQPIDPSPGGENPAGTNPAQPENWTIKLESVTVNDAEEDGLLSDGDEPYFMVVGFRSRFGTPGSTRTFFTRHQDDDFAAGADSGQTFPIPENVGEVQFNDVRPFRTVDALSGGKPEIIGAVAVGLESDGTPWSIIEGMIENLASTLETELNRLIADKPFELQTANTDFSAEIATASENVRASVEPGVGEAIKIFLLSRTDPDDQAGFHFFFLVPCDAEVCDLVRQRLPASDARSTILPLSARPRRVSFTGSGLEYSVATRTLRR